LAQALCQAPTETRRTMRAWRRACAPGEARPRPGRGRRALFVATRCATSCGAVIRCCARSSGASRTWSHCSWRCSRCSSWQRQQAQTTLTRRHPAKPPSVRPTPAPPTAARSEARTDAWEGSTRAGGAAAEHVEGWASHPPQPVRHGALTFWCRAVSTYALASRFARLTRVSAVT